jgi:Tol biopolymer transport system component
MAARCPIALLAVVIAACMAAPVAQAEDASYEGISASGDVALFSTVDKLVPGDTDTRRDIYERSFDVVAEGPVTRQVSFGPNGGNSAFDAQYLGTDAAGSEVFLSTVERLTATDKDAAADLYVRDLEENTTTLVSRGDASCAGTNCGNANVDAAAVAGGIVAGGERIFFASLERLSAADTDSSADVYVRDLEAEETILVSDGDPGCTGPGCGNGVQPAFFQGVSSDGTMAVFSSAEALVDQDTDSAGDLYRRDVDGEATTLVSTPGICPEATCTPVYGGISASGAHVYFETQERIDLFDSDDFQDVYDWSAGVATLASRGPDGGNGDFDARYLDSAEDGSAVFFATNEQIDEGADGDGVEDVYVRGVATALVSAGDPSCALTECGDGPVPSFLRWVSADGDVALLSTVEPLTAADEDSSVDVYRRDLPGGPIALISRADPTCAAPDCGNGAHNSNFAGASADGSRVFFVTAEPLAEGDTDLQTDVYERAGGATTRVSVGQFNGNGAHDAHLLGLSSDGSRAFLVTAERLSEGDNDPGEDDVYERAAAVTLLVSTGNGQELGPGAPTSLTTDPPGSGETTTPTIHGQSVEGAAIKIYTEPDCSGEQAKDPGGEPAGGSAEELADPEAGIAVSVASGSATTFYATAELEGIVSACSQGVTYEHQSDDPPGGGGSGSGGGDSPSPPVPPLKTHSGGIPYVAPVTRITFGPAFKTRARRPVFRFTDSTGQPDTRFVCKLDKGRWKPCGSPCKLKSLGRGKHVFSVKAVNAVGVWEASPTKRRFKLVSGR